MYVCKGFFSLSMHFILNNNSNRLYLQPKLFPEIKGFVCSLRFSYLNLILPVVIQQQYVGYYAPVSYHTFLRTLSVVCTLCSSTGSSVVGMSVVFVVSGGSSSSSGGWGCCSSCVNSGYSSGGYTSS